MLLIHIETNKQDSVKFIDQDKLNKTESPRSKGTRKTESLDHRQIRK